MQNEKPQVDWVNSLGQSSPRQHANRSKIWFLRSVVGIACIAVTAMILYPVFAVSHMYSGPGCISHVKQLGLALRMYQEDYDGRFPRAAIWMDATFPYNKNTRGYRCPTVSMSHPNGFGYAFNADLGLKTLDKHRAPEKTVVLYDSADLAWNANAPGRAGMAIPPRHQDGNNVGFADGHAKWQSLTGKGR